MRTRHVISGTQQTSLRPQNHIRSILVVVASGRVSKCCEMSLYHFNDWRHDLEHNVRPTHLINQHFGHGISPDDLLMPVIAPFFPHVQSHPQLPQISRASSALSLQPSTTSSHHDEHSLQRLVHHPTYADLRHYYRPWHLARKDHGSMAHLNKDAFIVSLDVQQFLPEEITVKVIDKDNAIVVEGKHEEREDEHGFISRQFTRKYIIPEGHDISKVLSHLSSDGVLTVSAPKIGDEEEKTDERIIPIVHTGPHKAVQHQASK